jgi:hypothetical protein
MREMIKEELIKGAEDKGETGIIVTTISREIGIEQRDSYVKLLKYVILFNNVT